MFGLFSLYDASENIIVHLYNNKDFFFHLSNNVRKKGKSPCVNFSAEAAVAKMWGQKGESGASVAGVTVKSEFLGHLIIPQGSDTYGS